MNDNNGRGQNPMKSLASLFIDEKNSATISVLLPQESNSLETELKCYLLEQTTKLKQTSNKKFFHEVSTQEQPIEIYQ